ncbi:hypothetical protein R1sor_013023 [Riccia sorocarpa]|uniref:PASTA domain-containing protein n=1 Tax=Riccia sorocarpa TaxID=122646 RepID=A0ABD3H865_9MARC
MFDISLTIGIPGSDIKETAVKPEIEEDEPPAEMEEPELPAVDETVPISVVNLERTEVSGADLDQVKEALLGAGFAVGRKTDKEYRSSE